MVCLGAQWRAACSDARGEVEAMVACRQLGFREGKNQYCQMSGTLKIFQGQDVGSPVWTGVKTQSSVMELNHS